MLHTALGQVAPTLLPPPWSHDLSPGSHTIHSPFPDPFCSQTQTKTFQRDNVGNTYADFLRDEAKAFHIYSKTHTIPSHKRTPPHPHIRLVSPMLARQQQPGVRVLRALIRGTGPIGKDH